MSDPDIPVLSPAQIERRIRELAEHIDSLRAYDVRVDRGADPDREAPALIALQMRIRDTLVRCFGYNTVRYRNFESAGRLYAYGRRGGLFSSQSTQEALLQKERQENIDRAIVFIESAQAALRADLTDFTHQLSVVTDEPALLPTPLSRRVFVVHGHDEAARETVARFLEKIGFEAIILHEQANQGRTVIEKIEAQSDVKFAVVLLTPDDEGRSVKEDELKPRARQNVLLELGYFIGRLGRDKVCALKRGDVDIPSDFAGVVWEKMDGGNGWKMSLGRELKAAGYEIDLNKAF
jgi:predicted nucleotide-binding protein